MTSGYIGTDYIKDNAYYSASRTWTPSLISTTAWYDASDLSTISESSNNVSQWNDKSGNNVHLTQANSSRQPLSGSTINSLNVLDFTNDSLSTSFNPLSPTISNAAVFMIHQVDSIGQGSAFSLTGDGNDPSRWQTHAPFADGRVYFDVGGTSSNNRLSQPNYATAGEILLSQFYCSVTENVQRIYKNGSLFAGDSTGHSVNTVGNIFVGTEADFFFQDMKLGEFIIINDTVSTDIRQRIEGYLAHKWGRTSSLPASHPYKTEKPLT